MSVEILDLIKQQAETLTLQEKVQLAEFFSEQIKRVEQAQVQNDRHEDVENEETMRRRRMAWLRANREQYGGQYVGLDGDQLVSTGRTFREATEAARAVGKPDAFVTYLSKPDEIAEWGGWV